MGKSDFFVFCSLFVVWAFRVFFFFAVWAKGVLYIFLLFGRRRGPRPNKKKTPPPKQQKCKHATDPSERFFLLLGRVGMFILLLGRGRVFVFAVWAVPFFFFLFRRCAFIFFSVWAGCFFCCLGGGRVFCLGGGGGACVFLLFGRRTGVHSLTGLPGLSLRDPTTKQTKQQKKHGFRTVMGNPTSP